MPPLKRGHYPPGSDPLPPASPVFYSKTRPPCYYTVMKSPLNFLLLSILLALTGRITAGETARPNILFILADDLGIDGVSCYGADTHKTTNIDKLAAAGTRFQ